MAIKVSLGILVLVLNVVVISGDVIVQTKSGPVAGKEVISIIPNEKYYSFLGIPYARPPVGKLRFKAPEPHPGWDTVLEAKKERQQCAQYNLPARYIKNYGFYGDEDCLHLSVHTPRLPRNENPQFPVIVFFYNEHFKITYNASKDYSPDFFMKEEVIFVTVNYRIGLLGFLSFQDDLLPGNNGLRDVILALRWLQENVKNFGGDPTKITLMGSMGGAALVDVLLHSPKVKGLFQAAILQSGTSWEPIYFDYKPQERAISLSEALKDQAKTSSYLLKRLADVPAATLTEAEYLIIHADEARSIQRPILGFGPIIEHEHPDAIITELPDTNPNDINVPIMIGYNSREGIELTERFLQKPQYLTFADRDFLVLFPKRVNYHFKINDKIYYTAIGEIKEHYFEEGYIKISKPGEYITYIGDIMSFYPIDYTVRVYTNVSTSPVYYYMFDYSGELNMRKKNTLKEAVTIEGTWGASLADELCYLFVCNKIRNTYKKLLEEDAEEIKVLNNMVRLWTNFAKTSKPTKTDDEIIWHPATKENKECLVISDELQMKTNLYSDKVEFWDTFMAKYEEKAVKGVIKDTKDEL